MVVKLIPSNAAAIDTEAQKLLAFKVKRVGTLAFLYLLVLLLFCGLIAANELFLIRVSQYFARESEYFSVTWFWFLFAPSLLGLYALMGLQPFLRVLARKRRYLEGTIVLAQSAIDRVAMSMVMYFLVFGIALLATIFGSDPFVAFMITLLLWGVAVHKGFEIAAQL